LDLPTLTPTHTPDGTSNDTLCDSPPATNPQNLRTLTPQLEVRTPVAKAIWGKNCFTFDVKSQHFFRVATFFVHVNISDGVT